MGEASGAAWLLLDGKLALVIAGDSGTHGDYVAIDPETGALRERGRLPLGDAPNDDLEGLASRGDKLYGILSAGWIWAWERRGGEFALVDGPYPIGPVDLPDNGKGETPPAGDGMVCPGKKVNCGRNYEGICVVDAAHASGPCAGFVASKADGKLHCLVDNAGRFAVDRTRSTRARRSGGAGGARRVARDRRCRRRRGGRRRGGRRRGRLAARNGRQAGASHGDRPRPPPPSHAVTFGRARANRAARRRRGAAVSQVASARDRPRRHEPRVLE